MSSAILYVAIVGIWLGVLVPRWLRHDSARDGQLRRRFSGHFGAGGQASYAETRAGFSRDGHPRYTTLGSPGLGSPDPGSLGEARSDPADSAGLPGYTRSAEDSGKPHSPNAAYVSMPVGGNTGDMGRLYETGPESTPVRPYGWSAEEYLRQERVSPRDPRPERPRGEHSGRPKNGGDRSRDERPQRPRRADPAGPHAEAGPHAGERPGTAERERRARMLRGRRRTLWMLTVLMMFAVGLAYLQVAAWWIVIPPTILLCGYLLLLREAAHADVEARERHAAERAAALARHARAEAQPAADAEHAAETRREAQAGTVPSGSAPVWAAHEPLPHAEIIDISGRVGDQLYDQYADAKLRAVGD